MVPNGMGWIIIDALDTMMLMNLTTELAHARQWIHSNLTYDQDHDVNTFETTIRMLGGLLSAHYLSVAFPDTYAPVTDGLSDDLYIEKAVDLADRLLGAYNTKSGVPFASVNLHTSQGIPSHADGGASSTAEATTLQLEMRYLAKLTGETHYWEHAEKVMEVVDNNQAKDGLVPIFIYADKGTFRGDNIRLGSRGDSYYEYLIKQYLQTSQQEPVYQAMWNESLAGVKKHLLTYSYPNNFTVLAERPNGIDQALSAKMDHLVCFMPGTIALATTGGRPLAEARKDSNWGPQQEEDMRIAQELTKTCLGMYRTPTGLAPEIANFNIHDPPLMYKDFSPETQPQSPPSFDKCLDKACTQKEAVGAEDYIIKQGDVHNLQRPETVESLFYMWRITGDEMYRRAGWEMFQAFMKHGAVEDGEGFSSVANVKEVPVKLRDNMESFWLVSLIKRFSMKLNRMLTQTRPKLSSTSTSCSRQTTYYRSLTLSSTPRPTPSPNLRWASFSRPAGNEKAAAATRHPHQLSQVLERTSASRRSELPRRISQRQPRGQHLQPLLPQHRQQDRLLYH
jgi:mannosyl-oligosaccharide alpha-1,2-mannosidase